MPQEQRRPRIGVMGGTFDPIHNGHLVAASEVQQKFSLDEVIFVPTGQPWMKREVTEGEHRYLMTVIATAANPRFTVSRVDIERDGPTYTVDTLRMSVPRVPMPICSSSPALTRSRRSWIGRTWERSGNSLTSSRYRGPGTRCPLAVYRSKA